MSPVDAAILRRKLGHIISALDALAPVGRLPLEEYRQRLYERKAAERLLQEAIEAALDINTHVIAEHGVEIPEDYYGGFLALGRLQVIPEELARRLAPSRILTNFWADEDRKWDWVNRMSICPRHREGERYFFASGFQFVSSVIGTSALSSSVLMRNRPSGATSYCRPCSLSTPPPTMRVGNSTTGAPGANVAPVTVIGAAIIAPAGLR